MSEPEEHPPFCDCYECWPPDVAQTTSNTQVKEDNDGR